MSKRKSIKTTISQAVDYWSRRIDECGLSVDWSEAHTHCWRCGCEKNLERCHIIPDSLGGEDAPHNIVLLCKRCHVDGPNVTDSQVMWDWIRAYGVPLYETFWSTMGMKEYQFIYKKSFVRELADIISSADLTLDDEIQSKVNEITTDIIKNAGVHFGHPYFNASTMAGVYRMVLKRLAEEYGVEFPIKGTIDEEPTVPWWFLN